MHVSIRRLDFPSISLYKCWQHVVIWPHNVNPLNQTPFTQWHIHQDTLRPEDRQVKGRGPSGFTAVYRTNIWRLMGSVGRVTPDLVTTLAAYAQAQLSTTLDVRCFPDFNVTPSIHLPWARRATTSSWIYSARATRSCACIPSKRNMRRSDRQIILPDVALNAMIIVIIWAICLDRYGKEHP